MDDSRIRQLREEVLAQVREGGGALPAVGLELRVAALEAAVADLQRRPAPVLAAVQVRTHPALQVLAVPSGVERCLMEPDRPCVQSHACRVLGH